MNGNERTSPLVIQLSGSAGEGVALPLGLSGMPTEIEGRKVYYRRKQICRVAHEPHRGMKDENGQPLLVDVPQNRLDLWADVFKRRLTKGIKPFLYPRHLDLPYETADARHTQGYLIDVAREGEKLYGTLQLIGDEALDCAAKNDVSVTVTGDALDPEFIHHLAFTPNQQITGMDGYTALVASADGKPVRVPVFVLSANNPGVEPERSIIMKPETITKLRARMNLPDAKAVPDEEIAERAATLALTDPPADKSAEVTALSADKTRLEGELSAAKQQVLSLSASAPKAPDAETVADYNERVGELRQTAIERGAVSAAQAPLIDKLITAGDGNPTVLALSAHGEGQERRRFGIKLWKAIAALAEGKDGAVRTGNAVTRAGVTVASPLTLSGDAPDHAKTQEDARKEGAEWQTRHLQGRQPVGA